MLHRSERGCVVGPLSFEERELEQVDHRSGAMAVLVHARFDDPDERFNGVLTVTVLPNGSAHVIVMELNVQDGAVSVTNPDPSSGALPEVDRLMLASVNGEPEVERVRASNLMAEGQWILDDTELISVFEEASGVAQAWLAQENTGLPMDQHASTVTLDMEFRGMAAGWPALVTGIEALVDP